MKFIQVYDSYHWKQEESGQQTIEPEMCGTPMMLHVDEIRLLKPCGPWTEVKTIGFESVYVPYDMATLVEKLS